MVSFLLDQGASTQAHLGRYRCSRKSRSAPPDDWPLLCHAAANGRAEVVELLVSKGIEAVDIREPEVGLIGLRGVIAWSLSSNMLIWTTLMLCSSGQEDAGVAGCTPWPCCGGRGAAAGGGRLDTGRWR